MCLVQKPIMVTHDPNIQIAIFHASQCWEATKLNVIPATSTAAPSIMTLWVSVGNRSSGNCSGLIGRRTVGEGRMMATTTCDHDLHRAQPSDSTLADMMTLRRARAPHFAISRLPGKILTRHVLVARQVLQAGPVACRATLLGVADLPDIVGAMDRDWDQREPNL